MKKTNTATTILKKNNDEQLNFILDIIEKFIDERGD